MDNTLALCPEYGVAAEWAVVERGIRTAGVCDCRLTNDMKGFMMFSLRQVFAIVLLSFSVYVAPTAAGTDESAAGPKPAILVYGASGRIGSKIVDEALARGYPVTGVTRDAERLGGRAEEIDIVVSDILDREATAALIGEYDYVIVSIGGPPADKNPANYIAPRAAESLIEVLTPLGPSGPRLIFVGSLFTLEYQDGKTLLELGRAPESHPNHAMFHGHQIALDQFRQVTDINWTVATPPNGLRLNGRTGKVRWGDDEVLRDEDGNASGISPEDFAFAVMEELENERYIRKRFTVAR